MVQLFYYENRGKNVQKLINYEGIPFRVNLFPSEELGSTLTSYWMVKIPWWRRTTAQIVEVYGGHYRYANAKVVNVGAGNIVIKGRFRKDKKRGFKQLMESVINNDKLSTQPTKAKHSTDEKVVRKLPYGTSPPYDQMEEFQLMLSTNVTNEDFQSGYSMTGTLEQGYTIEPSTAAAMAVTHFAVVKRKGY